MNIETSSKITFSKIVFVIQSLLCDGNVKAATHLFNNIYSAFFQDHSEKLSKKKMQEFALSILYVRDSKNSDSALSSEKISDYKLENSVIPLLLKYDAIEIFQKLVSLDVQNKLFTKNIKLMLVLTKKYNANLCKKFIMSTYSVQGTDRMSKCRQNMVKKSPFEYYVFPVLLLILIADSFLMNKKEVMLINVVFLFYISDSIRKIYRLVPFSSLRSRKNHHRKVTLHKKRDICQNCNMLVEDKMVCCDYCKTEMDLDHHCSYLNVCIGESNYAYFLRVVVSLLLFLVFNVSIAIAAKTKNNVSQDGNSVESNIEPQKNIVYDFIISHVHNISLLISFIIVGCVLIIHLYKISSSKS